MLADAIAAETFKLTKNWRTSFFAYLFLPILGFIIALAWGLGLRDALSSNEQGQAMLAALPMNLAQSIVGALQPPSFPLTILFCLIGAAVIFAGEYRWETWRLMAPRNTRANALLGKIIVYALAAAASLLLGAALSVVSGLVGALIDSREIVGGFEDGALTQIAGAFGVSYVNLLQAGAVAALAGVVTRSIMAALMVPLGLGIAQSILHAITSQSVSPEAMEWWRPFVMPSLAADVLKAALQPVPLPQMAMPETLVWASVASFATWIVVGYGGAFALFLRQDLSKE